ncbi:MAG: universal stress protein [Deltaproteobacteria bacterium]|nr:universal stress protein [Deltaproteobacteria bacterium]
MSFIKRILIPTDGSEYSHYALEYAVNLCRALQAEVVLVSIVDIRYEMYDAYSEVHAATQMEELIREQVTKALDQHAAEIINQGVSVKKIMKIGDVIHELLEVIREEHVDLVVVGTHGRKGLSRFLLGSTTEKLVRSASCPVLTVRPPE